MVDYTNIPRDSRRVPLATKVQFKFDRFSGFISEYSANISPTGMFIVSSNPEPPGRVLDLEFRLGDGFEIIQGKGEVVWSRVVADGPNRPPGMGIRFVELSPVSRDLIYRIVDRYVQEGGTPFDLSTARDRLPADTEDAENAAAAPAAGDLRPLDLEHDPFPDLDLDAVKDSAGNALPWFSAAPGAAAAGGAPPGGAPPRVEEEAELFPSIGPALEEVEEPFTGRAAARVPPREEPPAPPAPLLFPSAAPAPVAATAPPPADLFAAFEPPPAPAFAAADAGSGPDATAPPGPVAADPEAEAASAGLFADYLPKAAEPSAAPPRRPVASLAGSAAAQEPRRMSPWLAVIGVLVVIGAAAFALRSRIPVWLGLGGGDEEVVTAQETPRPLRPHKKVEAGAPPVVQDSGLTSSAAASDATAAAAPPAARSPVPAPVQPAGSPAALPEVVQRKPPSPAAAPASSPTPSPRPVQATPAAGPPLTAIDRITYEQSIGGTEIVLWGNGAMRPERFVHSQIGSPPRELIRITGIAKPFPQVRIPVGTGEVKQVRIGYHESAKGNELHVVIDLASPNVRVTRVDPDGQRLRIHLQKG